MVKSGLGRPFSDRDKRAVAASVAAFRVGFNAGPLKKKTRAHLGDPDIFLMQGPFKLSSTRSASQLRKCSRIVGLLAEALEAVIC